MVVNPGGLEMILALAKVIDPKFPAQYLRCPCCAGILDDPVLGKGKTLRIFPTMAGDFVFRCHRCGMALDSLEFLVRVLKGSSAEVSGLMVDEGIINQIHSPQELENYYYATQLRINFNDGRAIYDYYVGKGDIPRHFGDWACFDIINTPLYLPPAVQARLYRHGRCLLRLLRDIFGRPVAIDVYGDRHMVPLIHFSYVMDKAPMLLSMPAWTDYLDLNELVYCDSPQTAAGIERAIVKWPQEKRLPIAVPENPYWFSISSGLPYSRVWYMCRDDGNTEQGLALYLRGHTEVRIRRFEGRKFDEMPNLQESTREEICRPDLPECLEEVAREIVFGTAGTQPARLSAVLSRPFISGENKREILQKCAGLASCDPESLLNQVDGASNPYAVNSKGRLFVLRNNIYFMKDRTGRWSEISNFSLKSARKLVTPKGESTYQIRLSVEGRTTIFTVTDDQLDWAPRLWKEARRAAALAGLPELIMPNGQHRNFLPSLVKQTATPVPLPTVSSIVAPSPKLPGGHDRAKI